MELEKKRKKQQVGGGEEGERERERERVGEREGGVNVDMFRRTCSNNSVITWHARSQIKVKVKAKLH